MSQVEARLKELDLALPELAVPLAAYIPAIQVGNIVTTSGQLPMVNGKCAVTGFVGEGGTAVDEAAVGARICALNALAAIKQVIGDLDKIKRTVRVVCYVQSKPEFKAQPQVANGASLMLQSVFGEVNGKHIRSALGVAALPLDAAVEVELTVELK